MCTSLKDCVDFPLPSFYLFSPSYFPSSQLPMPPLMSAVDEWHPDRHISTQPLGSVHLEELSTATPLRIRCPHIPPSSWWELRTRGCAPPFYAPFYMIQTQVGLAYLKLLSFFKYSPSEIVISSSFGTVANPTGEEVTTGRKDRATSLPMLPPFPSVAHFQRTLGSHSITLTIADMTSKP